MISEVELGSCQYGEAERIYAELYKLDETQLKQVITWELRKDRTVKNLVEELKKDNMYEDDEEMQRDLHTTLDKCETIEDVFVTFRDEAWDLWSAAPMIADYFIDYVIMIEIANSVQGPLLNQLAQGENPEVAVALFLLVKHNLVTDVTCFDSFDT